MFKLVIQDDEGKTTVVPLIRDEITIGRKEGNTIRLTERNVSRRHARIMRSNGSITIEDLDSYNGIKLNGSRIQGKSEVAETDRVQIGDYLIEVRREGQDGVDAVSDDAETRPIPTTPAPDDVDPLATTPVPEQATVPIPLTPAAEPDKPPRVVVLSSNFAGQEWVLDKQRLVIGRTDENDVWINHRSISRHHAELVEEAGRWSIVDLQSSNGVRVNGEDYGKVELRRGDIVDLGHVRLRFVEGGEDFVFGRDAQAVDIATSGGGRSLGIILVIALLIGGGVAAYAMMGGGDEEATAKADAAAVVVSSKIDAGQVKSAPDASAEAPKNDEIAELLRRANEAVEGESWAEAEKLAKKILSIDSENTQGAALEQKALLEKSNLVYFDEFRAKANVPKPKYEEAVRLYGRISPESLYKERAKADYDKLKGVYVQRMVAQAERLAKAKKCPELKKLKANANVFPEAGAALRSVRCTKVANNDGNGTNNDTVKKPPPPPPEKLDVKATLAKARRAAMNGQYGAARNACEAILKAQPGNTDARSICLLAACALKRAKLAKRHYRKLPASRQSWAVQQCFSHGIELQ